jgi:hypothetical protein
MTTLLLKLPAGFAMGTHSHTSVEIAMFSRENTKLAARSSRRVHITSFLKEQPTAHSVLPEVQSCSQYGNDFRCRRRQSPFSLEACQMSEAGRVLRERSDISFPHGSVRGPASRR